MDSDETSEKHTFGESWQAATLLTLRGEVFYKNNTLHYVGYNAIVDASYQLCIKFAGYKVTVIAKPANAVSFTTRRLQVPMRPGM